MANRLGDPNLANLQTLADGFLNEFMAEQLATSGQRFFDAVCMTKDVKNKTDAGTVAYDFPFYGRNPEPERLSEATFHTYGSHRIQGNLLEPLVVKEVSKRWAYEGNKMLQSRVKNASVAIKNHYIKRLIDWIINGTTANATNEYDHTFLGSTDYFFTDTHTEWGDSGYNDNIVTQSITTDGNPTIDELTTAMYNAIAKIESMLDDRGKPFFANDTWDSTNIWILAHSSKRKHWKRVLDSKILFESGGLGTNVYAGDASLHLDPRAVDGGSYNDDFWVFFTGAPQKPFLWVNHDQPYFNLAKDEINEDFVTASKYWGKPAYCDFRCACKVDCS